MIHQYRNNGYNIVMDVASGSVHVVDDVAYDAIALLEPKLGELEKPEKLSEELRARVREQLAASFSNQKINEALGEIQELVDAGELFTKDIYHGVQKAQDSSQGIVPSRCP